MIRICCTCMPIILMILTGTICRKAHVLSDEGIRMLKKTALCITLPALMFSAFAQIDYSVDNLILIAIMLAVCFAGFLLGRLLKRLLRIDSRFMPYVTTTFELGMLGYALYAMLYPEESLGNLASMDIGLTLFANTIYRLLLNRESKTARRSGRKVAAEVFRSPVVIGIIAGITIGATGLYNALKPSGIASVIDACTDFFGAPTAAIILLTIGYDLVFSDVPWIAIGKTMAARLLIMAALRVCVGRIAGMLGLGGYAHAFNVVFILPTAFILPVLADDRKEAAYIASCLSVNTMLTLFLFVLLAIFA